MKKTFVTFFFLCVIFSLIAMTSCNKKTDVNVEQELEISIFEAIESLDEVPDKIITVRASDLRDYVGIINQGYHPDIIKFIGILKNEFPKNDRRRKYLDDYLEGGFGSGFVFVDTDGKNYIITNYHVISQSRTPSITFEKQNGYKVKYDNLKIEMIDSDLDLALLSFSNSQKPFSTGITIYDATLNDGDEVYTAGFPGLWHIPIWQFGNGIVSNFSVRLPKDDDPKNTRGPFIQHTAEVDPGNSGGPLLIDFNQSKNYVVVGVNTLKAADRQAANFAIPAKQVLDFIDFALGKTRIDERTRLQQRINVFIEGIKKPSLDYRFLSDYISDKYINEIIHEIIIEYEKSSIARSELKELAEIIYEDPIEAIKIWGAYVFFETLELNEKSNEASLQKIEEDGSGGYLVSISVNEMIFVTGWTKEYGLWKLNDSKGGMENNNSTMDKASQIEIGTTVNVNIQSNSVWYKVDIQSHSWFNIYTEGQLDTVISLYDNLKNRIAFDDDSGNGYNAGLTIAVSKGTYFIEVSRHDRTKGKFTLHARIGSGGVTNNSITKASYITAGLIITSYFQSYSDEKWYKIDVPYTARLVVFTEGHMDTYISVYNSQQKLIAEDDDSGENYNANIEISASGTFYIRVREVDGRTGEFKIISDYQY